MVIAEIRKYERKLGVKVDPKWYVQTFWIDRGKNPFKRPKVPRALELDAIANGPPEIAAAVREADQAETDRLTQELFAQRKRVGDAERALQVKETKKAREDVRIGSAKVEAALRRLDELKKPASESGMGRIYPGYYCPVLTFEDGRHVVRPMRYQCRLPGWDELVERRYPDTYNARRDKLETSWGKVFSHSHGVVLATAFYEHVDRNGQDAILEFKPDDGRDMIVACIWTRAVDRDGAELYSFAAITDDPPPEVVAAGHDRCIIPIKRENLDAWLQPDPTNLAALYAILDDRERPYYEHRLAA
ncbi:MAG TPA: SOS response-associated peptidase family protein [Luteimonas sp.]|nr:SOS response-associated peptidase family protein [Luteimonas sp.]